jgi:urate oxidase
MVYEFAGPSEKGIYSKSVQETLYLMAAAALKVEQAVDKVISYAYCLINI